MHAEAVAGERGVDGGAEVGMAGEEIADARGVAGADGLAQRFCGTEPEGLDVQFQLGPGGEAVFVGERVLGVREFALPHGAQQFFSLFPEKFEIGIFG